jgi:hypothetical protein
MGNNRDNDGLAGMGRGRVRVSTQPTSLLLRVTRDTTMMRRPATHRPRRRRGRRLGTAAHDGVKTILYTTVLTRPTPRPLIRASVGGWLFRDAIAFELNLAERDGCAVSPFRSTI